MASSIKDLTKYRYNYLGRNPRMNICFILFFYARIQEGTIFFNLPENI